MWEVIKPIESRTNEITEEGEKEEQQQQKYDTKTKTLSGDNDLECVNKNLNSTFTPFKLSTEREKLEWININLYLITGTPWMGNELRRLMCVCVLNFVVVIVVRLEC